MYFIQLFVASWLSVSILEVVDLGDRGDEDHMDSGVGILYYWLDFRESDMFT